MAEVRPGAEMQISWLAALVGGVISLLSPCSGLVIPTFVAAVGNRRGNLLRMTGYFSLGLMVGLLPLAWGASLLSRLMFWYRREITLALGWGLLGLGGLVAGGIKLPIPDLNRLLLRRRVETQAGAMIMLGLIGGVGSTACVGPILGAILSLAAASRSHLGAVGLMMAYGLGIVGPLVAISMVYDRLADNRKKMFKPKLIKLGRLELLSSNLLTGGLLAVVGYIFVVHQGSLGQVGIFKQKEVLNFFFNIQEKIYGW